MKILSLIPSFNEEKTIGWIVKVIHEMGLEVIVIDDGSQDNTARFASESGATVIRNEKNLGKGMSLRRGFALLAGRDDYDAVIIMDGDGQHLPSDIPNFIDRYQKNHAGVIVGNRMHKPRGMPWIRWLTNKFMSFILSKMCHYWIPDTQCGFRLIDKSLLKEMQLYTENFEIESEILLEAARRGYAMESVPIASIYEGQSSAIHPIKDTSRFLSFVFKKR